MSQARPAISIIVPVWNAQQYLQRCLESIRQQSFSDWEALCINDGSTDDSLTLLLGMAKQDPRFVVLDQNNQGVAAARNRGLRHARGKYVMFLDSDDFIHPQSFEVLVQTGEETNFDICQFKSINVHVNNEITFPKLNVKSYQIVHNFLHNFLTEKIDISMLIWDKIYKSEIAKRISFNKIRPGEDDIYVFESCLQADTYCFLDEKLHYYVENYQSFMHSISKEQFYENRLQISQYFINITADTIIRTDDTITRGLLLRYLTEHLVFKPYIIKGLHQRLSHERIARHLQRLDELHQQKRIDLGLLRLRYRLVLLLAKWRLHALARLLAN